MYYIIYEDNGKYWCMFFNYTTGEWKYETWKSVVGITPLCQSISEVENIIRERNPIAQQVKPFIHRYARQVHPDNDEWD